MKYLLIVLLILLILALAIVATLSMNIAFDEHPGLRVKYCDTHALLSIDVTLPQRIKPMLTLAEEIKDAVPRPLSATPMLGARACAALLGGIRDAYLSETKGCTAFR